MIESVENKVVYVIGNVAVFNFPYRFFQPDDLTLILSGSSEDQTLVRNQDYTVQVLDDYANGADITLTLDPLPAGKKLAIVRRMPVTQDLDLPEYGKLPSIGLENQLDKIIMICQEFKEELARCIKVSIASGQTPDEFLNSFISVVTSAKDVALNAATAAANSAASASGTLAIIGQIMADITGDDRYRTQTFDVLTEIWQAKGAIEGAAAAAMGDIENKAAVAIAATEVAVREAKEGAMASIQQNVSSAISDVNTTIAANVNAAIGADEVFNAAYAVASGNLNAVVTSALGDVNNVTSGYVDSAVTVISGAIGEWSEIYETAMSAGESAVARIAAERVSAYNTISGQLLTANVYLTSGGQQLSSMTTYLTSGGGQLSSMGGLLTSGGTQLSSMTTMLTSGGGILANCSSVLSWINTSVGQIYSSAKIDADASITLHNLAAGAHPNGFNHNLTVYGTGTPSFILQKTNGKTVHLHNGGSTFYILVETGSGGWINTDGFTVNTSTGRVGMVSATLSQPTISAGTISGTTINNAAINGTTVVSGSFIRKANTWDVRDPVASNSDSYLHILQDSAGRNVARTYFARRSDGTRIAGVGVFNDIYEGSPFASIAAGVDSSGNILTYAPTPASNDSSTKIATTAFAKSLTAAMANHPNYGTGVDCTNLYSAGVGWTNNKGDGWLYLMADKNSTDDAASLFLNGGLVCHSAQSQYVTVFVPVKNGDVLTSRNGATTSATINTNAARNPHKIIFYENR